MTDRPSPIAPFSSGTTFLNWPRVSVEQVRPGMIVAGGVPCEFTGSTIGPRLGPAAIRQRSTGINWRWREPGPGGVVNVSDGSAVRFREDAAVGDIGDVTIHSPQLERTTEEIRACTEGIVRRGGFPVMLGGDHYVGYPLALGYHEGRRALGETRFGYIQVDAHFDLQDDNPSHGRYWHGSNARRVAELDGFDPGNMVWLGLLDIAWRDEWEFVQRSGATAMTVHDMRAKGIERAVAEALAIAGRDTDSIYVSVDIDVCDNSAAPGTGFINFGGLSAIEFLTTLQCLGKSEEVGAVDLVEVTPPRDVGDRTAHLAARGLVEFLRGRILEPTGGTALIG